MNLGLESAEQNGWSIVRAEGELDVATSPRLREALIEAIRDNPNVVVDLTRTTFIDSTGLGVLVGALRRVNDADGSLRLVCTNRGILRVFEITGLVDVFGIYGDLDLAVSEMPSSRPSLAAQG
jgi:anti-sigma B factor antagonist